MKWRARLGGLGIVVCACALLAAPALAQIDDEGTGEDSVDEVFRGYGDLLEGDDSLPEPDFEESDLSDSSLPTIPDPDDESEDLGGFDDRTTPNDLDPPDGEVRAEEIPPATLAPEMPRPRTPAPEIAPNRDGGRASSPAENIPAGAPLDNRDGSDGLDSGSVDPNSYETIKERHPDGRVKIERGVTQDEQQNYINHGPWRFWDESGNPISEGQFRYGRRHGRWLRVYEAEEAELFSLAPFNLFDGPFRSEATFVDGNLEGNWVIMDASGNKICDWQFSGGRRNGDSIWYYHNGQTMRVIQYQDGQIHGELIEWDVEGNPLTNVEYIDGRRLEKTAETYEDGSKKVEGMVLQAQLVMKEPDKWWEAELAQYERRGKDEKHGQWKAWHPGGTVKFTGEYKWDKPAGEFIWWHSNGQKSLHAFYENGQKTGQWTWWHANGQKSILGQYLNDSPSDLWIWWHESGKVAQRVNFSGAGAPASSIPVDAGSGANPVILNQPQN